MVRKRSTGFGSRIEPLEGRLLMALAKKAGGSGYSANLSTNATKRQQQLLVDPEEPKSGSTSVSYDPNLVHLIGVQPGPGYDNEDFNGFVEVIPFEEPTQSSYFDGEFLDADWSVTTFHRNGAATSSGQQINEANSGEDDHDIRRRVTTNITEPDSPGEVFATVYSYNENAQAVYDPGTQGQINEIDYSEDFFSISGGGDGQAAGMALRQGETVFFGPEFVTGSSSGWQFHSDFGLNEESFVDFQGLFSEGGSSPDFSSEGAPIHFGFYRANSAQHPHETQGDIDNWSVTVNPVIGTEFASLDSAPQMTQLQNIFDFLEDPAGTETGFVQILYKLDSEGHGGNLPFFEGYTQVGQHQGVNGVDTHGLLFVKLEGVGDNAPVPYTAFAAVAGTHGLTQSDFLETADGTILGPAQLSSATVVSNAPPVITSTGGPYTINEGSGVTLHGTATDDGPAASLVFNWDLNGDNVTDATGKDPVISAATLASLGFGDGPKSGTITLKVSDGTDIDTETTSLTVNNVKPTASINSVNSVLGGAVTIRLLATDPSGADRTFGFKYLINWGDGTAEQTVDASTNNGLGKNVTHNYLPIGFFNISVKAVDKDGGTSDVVTAPVIISGAQRRPDPVNLSKFALFVVGSNERDYIRFNNTKNGLQVFDNNRLFGTFKDFTRVIVYGAGGNDDIALNDAPCLFFGGEGNDVLLQGHSGGILVGGPGSDLIYSGNGRDILIGGIGADLIAGGNGDDIVIAGRTSFDNGGSADIVALTAILNEWGRNIAYETRRDHILGTQTGGFNGSALFRGAGTLQTVFDDDAPDLLLGGSGRDWFFARRTGNNKDLLDVQSNETVTNL